MIEPALKQVIAAAVHQAVAEFDKTDSGMWRCKDYAVVGADLLRVLTGDHYESIAGFTGVYVELPPTMPLNHASGVPLSAKPTWAETVESIEDRARPGHAWIQNHTNIIDLSVKPALWGSANSLGEHWFEPDEDYTRVLHLYHPVESVLDITRRAIELAGPVWSTRRPARDVAHALGRIAGRWPALADELAWYVRR